MWAIIFFAVGWWVGRNWDMVKQQLQPFLFATIPL